MQEIKRILKMVNSEIFYKIIKISQLDETEFKLVQEFILRENTRDEVCNILGISRSQFNIVKNNAFTKIRLVMTNLLDEKIKQMA